MRSVLLSAGLILYSSCALAQNKPAQDLKVFTDTVAVSGYEMQLSMAIEKRLESLHPKRDQIGNVTVTFGKGAPHRLLVASMDEPGYVVSHIEDDGYLRVARLPQSGLPPHYNEMQNAQPMLITTRDGYQRSAVTAGLSIHLVPGRTNLPDPDDIDNMYIDLGARTKAEVLQSGIDVLSPLAAERSMSVVGTHFFSGTAVADRFGAVVLLHVAEALEHTRISGTTTVAFVTQQWTGSRGLIRTLQQVHPDELIYIGRALKAARATAEQSASLTPPRLGSGAIWNESTTYAKTVWLESSSSQKYQAAPFVLKGYGPPPLLPERTAHLSVPILYPLTAGEMIDANDLDALDSVLDKYLGISLPSFVPEILGPRAYDTPPNRPASTPNDEVVLKSLTLTYGVSEVETMSRDAVVRMLPAWAHPTTDAAGNLVLHFGPTTGSGIVFMAHTDELGFRVRSIDTDGTIQLDNKGGGTTSFYWGHPAVVHTSTGMRNAVVSLPENFDTTGFRFPSDFRSPATLNVGANSAREVEQLGIKVGDSVTIPKRFRDLLNRRISIRSLDDRVGCAALVHAVWALGEGFSRDVTFVWSTREELGLLGAIAYAESADKADIIPRTVFAIDTFVSSDSPLESKRYADGILGNGFVVRAIDSSNIVPWKAVLQVESIANAHHIPMQYGVTGGGNDGAAFQRYGSIDVALSWPLRYSHSPSEVIDLKDLEALSGIVTTLSREWN